MKRKEKREREREREEERAPWMVIEPIRGRN